MRPTYDIDDVAPFDYHQIELFESTSVQKLKTSNFDDDDDVAPLDNVSFSLDSKNTKIPKFDYIDDVTPNFCNVDDLGGDEDEEEGEFDSDEEMEGEEEVREKEKGVPAVMRCFDHAKIYVLSGDGGNGVVAMRREKFVPFGGPSGGDGGRGGNVYLHVDAAMNSLLPFRNSIHFRAKGRGSHGQGSKMNGAKGVDVVVKVSPGTVVRVVGKHEDVVVKKVT